MDPDVPRSPGSRLRVAVSTAGGWPTAPGLSRWLRRAAPARARGAVSVAVVSDATVRRLNRRYRGLDRATDVLSFPADTSAVERPAPARRAGGGAPRAPRFRGDIVSARGVARRQAREAGHAEATELKVLALHGLLHLLGYDHERDNGAMARLERRLRRKGGLREGLIERR
jgi:probable rRNA maturation factor